MKEDFPQVEKAAMTRSLRGFKLKLGEEYIDVRSAVATTSEIFDIFTLPMVGSTLSQNLLDDLNSIVLSHELAQKFFPDEDPVGKEIEAIVNDSVQVYTVNGVFKDIPQNSTFRAQCFVNSRWTLDPLNKTFGITDADVNWTMDFWRTWVKLFDKSDAADIDKQFRDFEKRHISENPTYNYSLQKLTDIYLKSDEVANTGIQGNLKNIRLFSAVAFLIVLIAAINYIILSIAVSTGRAKEIGIRKTAGAGISRIRNQLLSESIMLALFVLPIALLMMWAAMPHAEKLFQTNLQIIRSNIAVYISFYLVLTVIIGIASGIYASSYLSRLKVLDVLKNTIHFGSKKKFFRSSLIVLQLVIFCSFVSSTLVIRSQYRFAIEKEPGHYVEDVLLVNLGRNFKEYSAFMNNIKSNPNVIMAAGVMDGVPMMGYMTYMQPHFQDEEVKVKMEGLATDYHFLETMGITLLEGRYFSEEYGSDLNYSVILNETAVEKLGIEDPVGKQMGERTIVGVVKDFNLHSIHSDIPPLDISMTDRYIHQVAVHYKPGTLDGVLKMLKTEWEKAAPDRPFNYSTIEELIENQYTSEKNLSTILSIAALFTLLIAAFGLFGLTLFVARSRTNEIGIKKVFGSSERAIVYSFLRSNFLMVLIAELLSIPITIFFMTKWLNNFSYRTNIEWWVFVVAFIIAAIVVLATVFTHSYKASRVNPVKALRYE
jgi:putative ABC transport system permease protein